MKVSQLRTIIKESIGDRIKNIDNAGSIAAVRAKLEQVQKDIEEAHSIKSSYTSIQNLAHYLDPKLIKSCTIAIEKSINELEKAKQKIQSELDKLEGGKVPKKTSSKPEESVSTEEPESVKSAA